ncbi:MAG: FAD-binding oxidoreductase, partial [Cyclobacteriaceae bacterium]
MTLSKFKTLAESFEGDFFYDHTMRTLYATDASAYREMPLAVAMPRTIDDLKKLIAFARENQTSLIPRTAGTSLAGQVVGHGIVVDVSKYFTKILEVNKKENWVRVQPGVVRDELNYHLSQYELYFGPETSTANRAMIGGMVGNNSCGSNSIIYGSTRDHLLEVKALLSDGSEVSFSALGKEDFFAKCQLELPPEQISLESAIYRNAYEILANPVNREQINKEFPKKSINRRNTGYAIDLLMDTSPFQAGKEDFNFCRLIAGSEGTLAFITEVKLHVNPMPPAHKCLVCAHFTSIDESLRANLIALKYNPSASELMDQYILECTKANIEHRQNRFFVEG